MGSHWLTPSETVDGDTRAFEALRTDARPWTETAEEHAATQGTRGGGGGA